jgi:hypothetical protein
LPGTRASRSSASPTASGERDEILQEPRLRAVEHGLEAVGRPGCLPVSEVEQGELQLTARQRVEPVGRERIAYLSQPGAGVHRGDGTRLLGELPWRPRDAVRDHGQGAGVESDAQVTIHVEPVGEDNAVIDAEDAPGR